MNQEHQPDSVRFLYFLKSTYDRVLEEFPSLSFNKKHPYGQYIIGLYCKLVELTAGCLVLIEKEIFSGLPILFRSYLEAYVDLVNLLKDESYMYFLEATYSKEWLKLYRQANSENNPYLADLCRINNLADVIAKEESNLSELQEKGFTPLGRLDQFEKAGMINEYQSIYNELCCHSHNNKRSLLDCHAEIFGHDFRFVLFKKYSPSDIEHYVLSICDYLITISGQIHEKLDGMPHIFNEIATQWEKLKERSRDKPLTSG